MRVSFVECQAGCQLRPPLTKAVIAQQDKMVISVCRACYSSQCSPPLSPRWLETLLYCQICREAFRYLTALSFHKSVQNKT